MPGLPEAISAVTCCAASGRVLAILLAGLLLAELPAEASDEKTPPTAVSVTRDRTTGEGVAGPNAKSRDSGSITKIGAGKGQPLPTQADRELALRARQLAQDGNTDGALAAVEQLNPALKDTAFYFELKGTVQTLTKHYGKAESSFAEMLVKEPDSYVGRFNRAEAVMLQGRYLEAETEFAAVEKERSNVDPPVADLARFKRVACLLAHGSFLAAQLLVPPVEEGKESPALFYSRAMILWVRKDVPGATRVLEEARKQFSAQVDDLYTDTFVELNWGVREASGQFKFTPRFR